MKASMELGIKSPLKDAGFTKEEVRSLARQWGLANWDKPSNPCLSSRFPYGHTITTEKLSQVGLAEEVLAGLDFKQFRVRHHGEMARIEIEPMDFPRILDSNLREKIIASLKALGFTYITLDLIGFRSGSMNEALPSHIKGDLHESR
jgi:uncharacterized protein